MGTITPILDTLLPQVLGRAGDVARVGARAAQAPLSGLRPVSGEMSPLTQRGTPAYPGRESSAGSVRAASGASVRGTAADAANAREFARSITSEPGSSGRSAELHLSRAGGALARLLADLGPGRGSSAVTAAQPLSAGVPRPATLAGVLAQQVTQSGLFYESHLAAWVRGQLPRARLSDEPQVRLVHARGASDQGAGQNSHGAGASTAATGPIDPKLAPLVRQQIELLASGVFQWQGEAWVDAPMRWTVERREEDATETDRSAPVTTSLSLDLPGIGAFEAKLRLAGDRISVAAWAEPGAGRALIAADLETLRRRLRDAGLNASSVRLVTEPAA
ncbi:flagellar hook-length control protein FliK [Salinisphaera hydrothermalis]|uniref:Flagellar hook-length control protein-like C-terminal domain-containing protein n=1 Tax=Salinisphaera hydrothermalis (strain C41B8) TaxID=1304275 RepID=A0A084IMX0_SALHC|nr:flagellar hook-length control protein FliK [Salinisphaera hydrothermalis]KEZ78054.1 hypothetical protein C41B8_07157 [Salinisphaera hydrothermalis C41B8]